MRDESEKIVIYTDVLQSVLEGAFVRGTYVSPLVAGFDEIDVQAKKFAAEKIQYIRTHIVSDFVHSHSTRLIKDMLKSDESSDNATSESLEAAGFGVAKGK